MVHRLLFTKNSQFLISGSKDHTLCIWNKNKEKSIQKQSLSNSIHDVSISEDEKFISACCENGWAYLLDCSKIEYLIHLAKWKADKDQTLCTIFTPDSKKVLTSYKSIKVWNIESGYWLFVQRKFRFII